MRFDFGLVRIRIRLPRGFQSESRPRGNQVEEQQVQGNQVEDSQVVNLLEVEENHMEVEVRLEAGVDHLEADHMAENREVGVHAEFLHEGSIVGERLEVVVPRALRISISAVDGFSAEIRIEWIRVRIQIRIQIRFGFGLECRLERI